MRKKIKNFQLSRLTLGATSDFHDKVEKAIVEKTPAALHLEAVNPSYVAVNTDLQSVVNRETAYVATSYLKALDKRRDRFVGLLITVVKAHASNPIEARRDAATLLRAKLAPYVGIGNHEYAKQTAEVKGMLAKLALPEAAEAIATLSLEDEVEQLKAANEAFEEAFQGKISEAKARDPQSDLSSAELCARAAELYGEIVETVNAYALTQPSDEINDFIDDVNGIVRVYADIAEGSTSGGATTPTEPTDPSGSEGEDGNDDEGTDLPFEPTDPNPDEGGEEEETPSVV